MSTTSLIDFITKKKLENFFFARKNTNLLHFMIHLND